MTCSHQDSLGLPSLLKTLNLITPAKSLCQVSRSQFLGVRMCTSFHGGGVLFCLPQQERNLFLSQINVGIQGQNGGCRASSLHLLVQEASDAAGSTGAEQQVLCTLHQMVILYMLQDAS